MIRKKDKVNNIKPPPPPPNREMGEICGGGFCYETEASKQKSVEYLAQLENYEKYVLGKSK